MKFVFPEFLWALWAVLIPIAIHLFNFRRTKRVYFSQVSWLKEVKTETNYFRRLKQWLILACRVATLVLLVLAFAQPYFPSLNQKNIQNLSGLVSIYLDNSFSMQNEIGNEKYLSVATKQTSDLIKVFPKDARFQLLSNNFENKEQYPVPSGKIEDRLTEIDFGKTYRDLPTVYKRQLNLMERYSPNQKNQVFWFSDFQKSTAGDLEKVKLDSNNQYYLIPLKAEKTPNLMIDSVWLENPFIKALETNQINVRLKSYSEEAYKDLSLKLFIDEKQVSTASVSLAPNAQANAVFNFTVQGEGVKTGKISFEDFPVTFDNDYYFVINASPKVRILHLFDSPKNQYIQNVYENESVFDLTNNNVNNLDYNKIAGTELLILNEIDNLEGELANQIRTFVQKGGSLVVIPSPSAGASLSGFLAGLQISGVRYQKPDSIGVGKANELALLDSQQPFFRGVFEKVPNNMNMPYANAVSRWNNLGENLLTFKNRQPFLSRFQVQRGKVYLLASPLSTNYSNLAKHGIFVPIMYKIASLSKSSGERLAYTFQERSIRIKVDKPAKNQVYKLVKDKLDLVPAQRLIEDELILEMPEQATEAGYYQLKLDNKTVHTLAFNYDKAESAMSFYSVKELQSAFSGKKNVQVYDFTKNKNFVQEFKDRNIQINLWKYMLIFALVFLLLEILIVRLMKG
jgi:hypothetical protein